MRNQVKVLSSLKTKTKQKTENNLKYRIIISRQSKKHLPIPLYPVRAIRTFVFSVNNLTEVHSTYTTK